MTGVTVQVAQLVLVLLAAPFLTGLARRIKGILHGRRGPSPLQPYRDIVRLLRKDIVMAENASWLFRATPYLVFAAMWTAAALVPTFTTAIAFGLAADLIALVALLGSARFFTALAGMDVGTSFGGIGSSREMMIASLAEPAMLAVIFALSLFAHTTSLAGIAEHIVGAERIGLEVSLAFALLALIMVAVAETGRIPVDNPATHLELTMVHEAMVLEYSGLHLALIEAAGMLKLLLYVSLIGCVFAPWGMAVPGDSIESYAGALGLYGTKIIAAGILLPVFETSIAKMRVFRYPEFLGAALLLGLLATIFLYVAGAI
jgi:formate hydrogenlyase subunit 4